MIKVGDTIKFNYGIPYEYKVLKIKETKFITDTGEYRRRYTLNLQDEDIVDCEGVDSEFIILDNPK